MTGQELQELLDSIDTDDPSNFGAVFRILMFEAKPALERGDVDAANAAMESAAIVALAFDRAHNTQDPAMDEAPAPPCPTRSSYRPTRSSGGTDDKETDNMCSNTACVPTRLLRACGTARKRV